MYMHIFRDTLITTYGSDEGNLDEYKRIVIKSGLVSSWKYAKNQLKEMFSSTTDLWHVAFIEAPQGIPGFIETAIQYVNIRMIWHMIKAMTDLDEDFETFRTAV